MNNSLVLRIFTLLLSHFSGGGQTLITNFLIAVFGESVVGLENPYFQPQEANVVNATTPLGATTFLPCQINKLGGNIVSKMEE